MPALIIDATAPADDLVVWLDASTGVENATWFDRSGNGNHANVGGATFVPALGGRFAFDGNGSGTRPQTTLATTTTPCPAPRPQQLFAGIV
jgi:hypothetical protein